MCDTHDVSQYDSQIFPAAIVPQGLLPSYTWSERGGRATRSLPSKRECPIMREDKFDSWISPAA